MSSVAHAGGVSLGDAKPLAQAFHNELLATCRWWQKHVIEDQGFVGEISCDGLAKPEANKGVILCARLLWFYSEAALYLDRDSDATRAASTMYSYLTRHFLDHDKGGAFWELSANGSLLNGRKQIYAQAFVLYALSAYARLTGDQAVVNEARSLFLCIERYGRDREYGGYFEAFDQHWQELDDVRLSDKDLNSAKTMNTHLHVIEAYSAFLLVEREASVESALRDLLEVYMQRFFDERSKHLHMFLSRDWLNESEAYSYGHDIESSWLLAEAFDILGDEALSSQYKPHILALAESSLTEGLMPDGSMGDEFHFSSGEKGDERIWWVQAEAMVGFYNAFQMSGDTRYLEAVKRVWAFIQREMIDTEHGEWHWLAKSDQKPGYSEYKAGFWKCPYHNGRAMIELCRRMGQG